MRLSASACVFVLAIGVPLVARSAARPQTGCVAEDFTAAAVNRGEHPLFLAPSLDIRVTRWSTETEKDGFARTLLDRGADALLKALRDIDPVGSIRAPNAFPYDLRFAWQEPLEDGGRRLILITDRPMLVWKAAMGLEQVDDTFTVIEIRLNTESEGEGKVAIATNITVNRSLDLIELKRYDTEPVRLTDVRRARSSYGLDYR